jgi:hypothetical protein
MTDSVLASGIAVGAIDPAGDGARRLEVAA